jgi:DNA-binding NarL/FixJ family response regulator
METGTGNEARVRRPESARSLRLSILDEEKNVASHPEVKPYRILIADDHILVRRGLRTLLETHPGWEVSCEAATGVEAVEHIRKGKADLVIMDLTMPEMNGLEAARTIRQESPATEVLVLTMHFNDELAREVLRSGALGYVLKSDPDKDLLAAVDHMRQHQPYFSTRLAISMAQNFIAPSAGTDGASDDGPPGEDDPLTDRELEVARLLAHGKSNKETAAALGVSSRTIESHRNHIMNKMGFASFSDLVRFAVRNNLVEP